MWTTSSTCRQGTSRTAPFSLVVTPEQAGWAYSGLQGADPAARRDAHLEHRRRRDRSSCRWPASRRGDVRREHGLRPRRAGAASSPASPTSATPPRDATGHGDQSEHGGPFALPSARCASRLPPRYGPGRRTCRWSCAAPAQASRQVNNFCSPEAFECDRLIAVEVLTPGGNWSSYPPHKHDEDAPGTRPSSRRSTTSRSRPGLRATSGSTAPPDRPIDVLAEVRTGRRRADPARLARAVDGRRPATTCTTST